MSDSKFHDASDETQELFNKIVEKLALPFAIKFHILATESQKCLIKISKVSDLYQHITKYDIIVMFNETYIDALDEQSCQILIQQELDKLECDLNSGKIKIGKPELSTSVGVIKKYGIDDVAKANQLEELFKQQKDDGQLTDGAVVNTTISKKSKDDDAVDFLS